MVKVTPATIAVLLGVLVIAVVAVASKSEKGDEEEFFNDDDTLTPHKFVSPKVRNANKTLPVFDSFVDYEKYSKARNGKVTWHNFPPEHVYTSDFYLQKEIVSAKAAQEIIHSLKDIDFTSELDSVDNASTFEFWLHAKAAEFDDYPEKRTEVMKKLQPFIDSNVMPLVDAVFPGEKLKPCFSFIRRYTMKEDEERMKHPTHFDVQAYATMVVSLNTFGKDFTGGLYVATSNTERHYLNLASGDGALHQSDLLHGVQVFNGTRWSWIQWFSGPGGSCGSDPRTWHVKIAEPEHGNSPLHQFLLAQRLHTKLQADGKANDAEEEYIRWLRYAARGGFPIAQAELGAVLLERYYKKQSLAAKLGKGKAEAQSVALEVKKWFERSAAGGEAVGMGNLGMWYRKFPQLVEGGKAVAMIKATEWSRKACEAESAQGCSEYATALWEGTGGVTVDRNLALEILGEVATIESLALANDKVEALGEEATEEQLDLAFKYLGKAARMGHPQSQYLYAKRRVEEVDENCPLALKYLEAAALNGNAAAMKLLDRMGYEAPDEREYENDF